MNNKNELNEDEVEDDGSDQNHWPDFPDPGDTSNWFNPTHSTNKPKAEVYLLTCIQILLSSTRWKIMEYLA